MRLFIGRGNAPQEDAELPLLVTFKAVEEGFVGGGVPGGRIVAVGVSTDIQDGLGKGADTLFHCRDMHDLLPNKNLRVNYSAKANSNLEILKIVRDEDIARRNLQLMIEILRLNDRHLDIMKKVDL